MQVVSSIDPRSDLYRRFLRSLKPHQEQLWTIMESTGLRLGDAIRLTYSDLRKGWIREGKTGFIRPIRLTVPPKPAGQHSDFVTANPRTDRPYNRATVSRAYSRAAHHLHFPVPFGAHSARKMYALKVYQDTGDLHLVQLALNHKYLSTTLLYIWGHPHITKEGNVVTYGINHRKLG